MSDHDHLDCATALNKLFLVLDGEADPISSCEAKEHLAECARCLREYGLEQAVKQLVHRACGHDDLPPGLRDRVLRRLREVTITVRIEHSP